MKQLFFFLFLIFSFIRLVAQDSVFVLGEIKEIGSAVLAEKRILNIYLPEGYNRHDTIEYPVIYLLDGSADEDFIHVTGLVQFANFSWVNLLPPSIVVGIANVDRKRDFTYPTTIETDKITFPTTGGSAKFIDFIEQELQPFIKNTYATNGSATLIGQSLGGLLATEILLKKPSLFNRYIIVSPSLWWDNESLLAVKPAFTDLKNTSVYVAVGKEEKVMVNDAKKLVSILKKEEKLEVKFDYLPDKDHGTILHQAVYNGFEWLKSVHAESSNK